MHQEKNLSSIISSLFEIALSDVKTVATPYKIKWRTGYKDVSGLVSNLSSKRDVNLISNNTESNEKQENMRDSDKTNVRTILNLSKRNNLVLFETLQQKSNYIHSDSMYIIPGDVSKD